MSNELYLAKPGILLGVKNIVFLFKFTLQ